MAGFFVMGRGRPPGRGGGRQQENMRRGLRERENETPLFKLFPTDNGSLSVGVKTFFWLIQPGIVAMVSELHTPLRLLALLRTASPPPLACAAATAAALPAPAPPAAPPPPAPERAEDPATHARLLALLARHGAAFTLLRHPPTRTCEESAAARGAPVASGAKAMLLKASRPLPHGSPYLLAVLSAARRADLRALRCALGGQKSVSLAPVEDVWRLAGCVPGAVPPFGSLFPGVRTYCDPSLVAQGDLMNFNAALRGESVVGLRVEEFLRIEQPVLLAFSAPMASEAPE